MWDLKIETVLAEMETFKETTLQEQSELIIPNHCIVMQKLIGIWGLLALRNVGQ